MRRSILPVRSVRARGLIRRAVVIALTALPLGCLPDRVSVEVGSPAPALSLTGANRDGVLPEPLNLRDFRGQTVVFAFFFKARTPG